MSTPVWKVWYKASALHKSNFTFLQSVLGFCELRVIVFAKLSQDASAYVMCFDVVFVELTCYFCVLESKREIALFLIALRSIGVVLAFSRIDFLS